MSSNVAASLLVLAALPWAHGPAEPQCGDAAEVLAAAETAALAGEFAAAAAQLRGHYDDGRCHDLVVAAWAWEGWQQAIAAARQGGSDESLSGVRAALAVLEPSGAGAAYATAVVRAATAAAQDERDEMQVWLEHARDLARRGALVKEPARWPLPIDIVEGELWSSLDDDELAEASFTRALAERDSAVAWHGLARARDGRGNRAGACDAYRHALKAAMVTTPAGVVAGEARRHLLVCQG